MLVLNLFSHIVCLFGEVVMQDYWMTFLKLRNDVLVLFLILLFRLETLPLFLELGWLPINQSISVKKNPEWTCTGLVSF